MNENTQPRVVIGLYFNEDNGRCTSIDVQVDRDMPTDDIARLALALAGTLPPAAGSNAATEIIPKVRVNDQQIAGSEFWDTRR